MTDTHPTAPWIEAINAALTAAKLLLTGDAESYSSRRVAVYLDARAKREHDHYAVVYPHARKTYSYRAPREYDGVSVTLDREWSRAGLPDLPQATRTYSCDLAGVPAVMPKVLAALEARATVLRERATKGDV